MPANIYLVAGETSGDVHGAELMSSLQERDSQATFYGLGGSRMGQASGGQTRDWIERAAVMGYVDVIKNLSWFKEQFNQTLSEILKLQPDILILIDYPGFNLRLAAALRPLLPEMKIVQYVAPQVWAWKAGRIPKMAKCIDLVLCLFPFEPPLFESVKLPAKFIGHPLIDELASTPPLARKKNLVALLPGSRKNEINSLFPTMLQTAIVLQKRTPSLRFITSAASPESEELMRSHLAENPVKKLQITTGKAHQAMQKATCGLVASGTATLEAAYFGLPYALVYKISPPLYLLAKMVIKVKYAGIVNILAGRELVPEFLQSKARPNKLASHLQGLIEHPSERKKLTKELQSVVATLGAGGFNRKAAIEILKLI